MNQFILPYGGALQQLLVDDVQAALLKKQSQKIPSLMLNNRQLCDLELLMCGAFSPLNGFLTEEAYESVLRDMCLPDKTLWPIPITLDVADTMAEKLEIGGLLALRDSEGFVLAVLKIESVWKIRNKKWEAERIYGTTSNSHPGVRYLYEESNSHYVGGKVEGVRLPAHYDFEKLRNTPQGLRHLFDRLGWQRVAAFHTSKPMHRLQKEITLQVAEEIQAHVLLHPAVGMTKPGDLHYYARVHCYEAILRQYPNNLAMLSLLPLAMRMAGPREALLNAIVRQNYGCTHIIIGPDHAAPDVGEGMARFYPPYAAQNLIEKHQDDLKIRMIPIKEMRYVPKRNRFLTLQKIECDNEKSILFTDSDFYHHLAYNKKIPDWFSYPEVITALRKVCPPRNRMGVTLFFTGLSGAGKSTLARILYAKFIEEGARPVTLLDGDIVRHVLSSELGFSKEHRDLNIRRIGYVASEITKNGGIAICAPIAPYATTRRAVREIIEQHGAFIEIHVATPLAVCEDRDPKGLYAKARKGLIPEFTGISDPYEIPGKPEIRIDTSTLTPMQAVQEIILYLVKEGYLESKNEEDTTHP